MSETPAEARAADALAAAKRAEAAVAENQRAVSALSASVEATARVVEDVAASVRELRADVSTLNTAVSRVDANSSSLSLPTVAVMLTGLGMLGAIAYMALSPVAFDAAAAAARSSANATDIATVDEVNAEQTREIARLREWRSVHEPDLAEWRGYMTRSREEIDALLLDLRLRVRTVENP